MSRRRLYTATRFFNRTATTMKDRQQVRDMKVLLRDMELYVKDPRYLHKGEGVWQFQAPTA